MFGYWKNVDLCVCVLKSVGFCMYLFENKKVPQQKNNISVMLKTKVKKKKSAKTLKKAQAQI